METSLVVRIVLIIASCLAMVCEVISLLGHGWYGFTIKVIVNETTVTQRVSSGLFYRSPYEICIDGGNGTVCKRPDEFPPAHRVTFQAILAAIDESFDTIKALVIIGQTASVVGVTFLYIYLCMSRKGNAVRCTGIICAVSWVVAALADSLGAGMQIIRYKNEKNSLKHMEEMIEMIEILGIQVEGGLTTPWAVIFLGIGACWAILVGLVVALTTCGKRLNKTVIKYKELLDKEEACLMNEDDDD